MRNLSFGILAQILTFSASIVPIIFGLTDQLVTLVLLSSCASILVQPATLGLYSIYPGIRDEKRARISLVAAWITLGTVVFSGLVVAGVSWYFQRQSLVAFTCSLSGLVFAQGMFLLDLANLTRNSSVRNLMYFRISYGSASLLFTTLTSIFVTTQYSLVWAATASYLIVSMCLKLRMKPDFNSFWRLKGPSFRYIQSSWSASGTFLLSGLAAQSGSLLLPLIGPFAASWAAATRIANGFQTLGAQVLAPDFDQKMSTQLRSSNPASAAQTYKNATIFGGALSVVGIVAILTTIFLFKYTQNLNGNADLVILIVSIVGYWGSQIATSVGGKYLTLSGMTAIRFRLEMIRLPFIFIPFIFVGEAPLLLWVSLTMFASTLVFIGLGFWCKPRR